MILRFSIEWSNFVQLTYSVEPIEEGLIYIETRPFFRPLRLVVISCRVVCGKYSATGLNDPEVVDLQLLLEEQVEQSHLLCFTYSVTI